MKKVIFIKNALVLTATALILRLAGIIFKVWLAAEIGSEGIGLYQLIISVYVLASTFATSGISTAVTRLVTDELSIGSGKGALRVLKKGITLSLIIAFITLAVTFTCSKPIASYLLGDLRAAPAIKILGLSLPFMAVSSCIRGYFIARRKTLSSSLAQILEQAARIGIVLTLAAGFASKGISYACAAVLFGDTAAEGLSCLFLFFSLRLDREKIKNIGNRALPHGFRKIIRISLPITSGRYLNSGLRTAENLMVPRALTAFGGAANSLSLFGMIKGMALPILFFPSSFLNSVSTLLIPEMSEAMSRGQQYKIRYVAEKVMTLTAVSSFWLASLFFSLSAPLGQLIYKSGEVGFLLKALAPIVPLMYIDSVSDGILKGLDQQSFCFRVSVFDSALRLVLILLIVPKSGMNGFLFIMIISNLLTAALRVYKMLKISKVRFDTVRWVLLPLFCAAVSTTPVILLFEYLPFSLLLNTVLSVIVASALYITLSFITRTVCADDVRDLIK